MTFEFIYITEEHIEEAIKDTGRDYPECLGEVYGDIFTVESENAEQACMLFFSQVKGRFRNINIDRIKL